MLTEEVYKQFDQKLEVINGDISKSFDEILAISHSLVTDELIQRQLEGQFETYISDKVIMDRIQSQLLFSSLEPYLDITFQDSKKILYSNWSRNFNSYDFLFDSTIAIEAMNNDGSIVFDDFVETYNLENKGEQSLSLYRRIQNESLMMLTVSEKLFHSIFNSILSDDSGGVYLVGSNGQIHTGVYHDFLSSEDLSEIYPISSLRDCGNIKWQSRRFLYYRYQVKDLPGELMNYDWSLYMFLEYKNVSDQIVLFTTLLIVANMIAIALLIILFIFINKDIVKPITELNLIMKNWALNKKLNLPINKKSNEIGQMFDTFSEMDKSIRELFINLNNEHEIRELYQYKALRSRLNPHFLFNTLNTVKMLAVIDKNNPIVSMIDSLGGILDYSMRDEGGWVTLKEELAIINNYVTIQNTRFSNSIRLVCDIDEELDFYIIKFLLQPVVENIFVHGFDESKIANAKIEISARIDKDILFISIEDNGIGIPDHILKYLLITNNKKDERDSIGLPVINEMIKTLCGTDYGLSFSSKVDVGTKVLFRLPLVQEHPKRRNNK